MADEGRRHRFLGFWPGFGVEAVQENPSNIP